MPYRYCNRRKSNSNGYHITYCNCGGCNHCHYSGICSDRKHHQKVIPGQSHGRHRWVPDCWCEC